MCYFDRSNFIQVRVRCWQTSNEEYIYSLLPSLSLPSDKPIVTHKLSDSIDFFQPSTIIRLLHHCKQHFHIDFDEAFPFTLALLNVPEQLIIA